MPGPPAYRVAVCGCGPAGLAALRSLKKFWGKKAPEQARLRVDVIDANYVPGGTLREGVAPDKLNTKEIVKNITAQIDDTSDGRSNFFFKYHGGLLIDRHVNLATIRKSYHATILTLGNMLAVGHDTVLSAPKLQLPREFNPGVVNSLDFVKLYNGTALRTPSSVVMNNSVGFEPDSSMFKNFGGLSQTDRLKFGRFLGAIQCPKQELRVGIIGQGNVSLDIARMLAHGEVGCDPRWMTPASREFLKTAGEHDNIEIHILGRRGLFQAAWKISNLRRLLEMGDKVDVIIKPEEFDASMKHPLVQEGLKSNPSWKRTLTLLENSVKNTANPAARTRVYLRFFVAPKDLNGPEGCVNKITIGRTHWLNDDTLDVSSPARGGETLDRLSLVVKSLGYGRASSAEGILKQNNFKLTDDENIPHLRVLADENGGSMYVAGWFRTFGHGPAGAAMTDADLAAEEVVNELLSNGPKFDRPVPTFLGRPVPYIGNPVTWHEAMALLVEEERRQEKCVSWKHAAQFIQARRALEAEEEFRREGA